MINVLICEDDIFFLNTYRLAVKRYAKRNPEQGVHLYLATSNPNTLLKSLSQLQYTNNVFILDIEFSDSLEKGIDLAKHIRDTLNNSTILFITSHTNLAISTIESRVQPFDFISKDSGLHNIQESIFEDLSIIATRKVPGDEANAQYFEFTTGSRHFKVPVQEINYVTTSLNPHHVILSSVKSYSEFSSSLKECQEQLPDFKTVSRSLVVNPANIRIIDRKAETIIFKDGSDLRTSLRALKKLM